MNPIRTICLIAFFCLISTQDTQSQEISIKSLSSGLPISEVKCAVVIRDTTKGCNHLTGTTCPNCLFFEVDSVYTSSQSGKFILQNADPKATFIFEHSEYLTRTIGYLELGQNQWTIWLLERPFPNSLNQNRFFNSHYGRTISQADIQATGKALSSHALSATGRIYTINFNQADGDFMGSGFSGKNIGIRLDGVPVLYPTAGISHQNLMNTLDADQLESAFFSTLPSGQVENIGGFADFISKKPQRSAGKKTSVLDVNGRFNSANGEKTTGITLEQRMKFWAVRSSLKFTDQNDLMSGHQSDSLYGSWGSKSFYTDLNGDKDTIYANSDPRSQSPSGFAALFWTQHWLFQKGNHTHQFHWHWNRFTDAPDFGRLTFLNGQNPYFSEAYNSPPKRLHLTLNGDIIINSGWADRVQYAISSQKLNEARHSRYFGDSLLQSENTESQGFVGNLSIQKRLKKNHFKAYFEYQTALTDFNRSMTHILNGTQSTPRISYQPEHSLFSQWNITISHKYTWKRRWTIFENFRLNHYQNSTEDEGLFGYPLIENEFFEWVPGGDAGLEFRKNDHQHFLFTLGSGNNPVNNSIYHYEQWHPTQMIVSAYAGIQRNYFSQFAFELSDFQTYGISGSLSAAFCPNYVSSIQYSNYLWELAYPNIGSIYTREFGKEVWYGTLQAEGWYLLDEHFTLLGSLQINRGQFDDKQTMPLITPAFGILKLRYIQRRLKLDAFAVYQGWKGLKDYSDYPEDQKLHASSLGTPAWMTLNMVGTFQIHNLIKIQFGAENLLDSHYRTAGSAISGPGRNFRLGLIGNFQ